MTVRTNTALGQATLYSHRERRRANVDPALGLFRTHTLGRSGTVQTGMRFPDRFRPITFQVGVRRLTSAARGTIFEFGDTASSLIAYVNGASLEVAVGTSTGDNGVSFALPNVFPADNSAALITIAIIPARGYIVVFIDHAQAARVLTASGGMSAGWGNAGQGAIGTIAGTANSRIDFGGFEDLANAEIIKPLSGYQGQVPRSAFRALAATQTIPLVPTGQTGSFSSAFDASFDGGGT